MIVCPECGTRNPPGTQFCGECGTFLEWAGDEGGKAAATTTQTARAGGGTTTAEPVSPPAPDTGPAPEPPGPKPVVEKAPEPEQLAPRPPEPKPPVAEKVEEKPADTGIGLVQPDAKQRRYNTVTTDEPATETPGDIECANCGIGNIATRKFCRSCGHLLARPASEAKKSWWRRMWDKIRGRDRRYDAGTRRVQRRGGGWLRKLVVALGAIILIVAAFTVLPTRGYLNQAITAIRDRTSGTPSPVRPKEVHASSSRYGADPTLISDTVTNKFWSPDTPFAGQWVEATFDQPVRLLNVIVTPGVSTDAKKFISQGRPHDIIVTTTNEDNEQKAFPLVVQDKAGPQTFEVKVSNVKRVRLTLISCYDDKKVFCGVGEVEFLKRG